MNPGLTFSLPLPSWDWKGILEILLKSQPAKVSAFKENIQEFHGKSACLVICCCICPTNPVSLFNVTTVGFHALHSAHSGSNLTILLTTLLACMKRSTSANVADALGVWVLAKHLTDPRKDIYRSKESPFLWVDNL